MFPYINKYSKNGSTSVWGPTLLGQYLMNFQNSPVFNP